MWYGMTKYSFDSEKPICGPFKTEAEAWEYIEKMADEEYRIDVEESEWCSDIKKDKTCGEIVIKNFFTSGDVDVTEFLIFEVDNTKLM